MVHIRRKKNLADVKFFLEILAPLYLQSNESQSTHLVPKIVVEMRVLEGCSSFPLE